MTTRAGTPPVDGTPRGYARPRATRAGATPAVRERGATLERWLLWIVAIGRRGIVVGLALAVLVAFAAGTIEQRWKEGQLRDQVAAQQASLQAAEARNAQLRGQLAESDPEAYRAWVEATARRQLNLGYSGETIFLVNWHDAPAPAASAAPTPAAQTVAASPPPAEAHWRKWLRLIAGE